MDLHVFPIPIPPPASLPIPSLWVFPVHQPRALVSCIQPGLVISFTLDSILVSMLFSQNIPPSPSLTESKSLLCTSVSLFLFSIEGYHYHLFNFYTYALVYCVGLYLSGLLHGGIGRGDHFLPHKFIKRSRERWANSTKQLLITSRGHQTPRKAAHCLWKEIEQNIKDKMRDNRVRDGDLSWEGSLNRGSCRFLLL